MPDRRSAATLEDVARQAGVSLATASRAINGSARQVNETYRQRVLDAAEALNYIPNSSAQAVARGASSTVALVVSDIADPYFSSIVAGAVAEASRRGLAVTVSVSERASASEAAVVRALRAQRPRSIVMLSSRLENDSAGSLVDEELAAYEASGGRAIFVGSGRQDAQVLALPNREGAHRLGAELAALGCRRVFVLVGDRRLVTARERLAGFRSAFEENGVPLDEDCIVETAMDRDGGYDAARGLLARLRDGGDSPPRERPLIFAVSDVMAVGALAALREAGLSAPKDVAVAGFDDIPTLRDVTPSLTTVRLPLGEIGRRLIRLTVGDDAVEEPIEATVLLRESTAVPA